MSLFHFGEDPNPIFIFRDSSPLRDRAKNDIVLYSMIFQKCIGPRYVLVDQALRGGGMRSTECPSSLYNVVMLADFQADGR